MNAIHHDHLWRELDAMLLDHQSWRAVYALACANGLLEYRPGAEAQSCLNEQMIEGVLAVLHEDLSDEETIAQILIAFRNHPESDKVLTHVWDSAKKRTPLHYLLHAGKIDIATELVRQTRPDFSEHTWAADIAGLPFKTGADLHKSLNFLQKQNVSMDVAGPSGGILSVMIESWKNHGFSSLDLNHAIDLVQTKTNTLLPDHYGYLPWVSALRAGCARPTLDKLLQHVPPELLNQADKHGWTACHHAATVRRPDLVRALRLRGANWPSSGPNPEQLARDNNWASFRRIWFSALKSDKRNSPSNPSERKEDQYRLF